MVQNLQFDAVIAKKAQDKANDLNRKGRIEPSTFGNNPKCGENIYEYTGFDEK